MRIVKAIGNVHMGLGHSGLTVFLKKFCGLDVTKMKDDEFVVLINTANDKAKIMMAGGENLTYIKPKTGKISLNAIRYLPYTFGAKSGFNYDEAVKLDLIERLGAAKPAKKAIVS